MILVDTSVWIAHLNVGDPTLAWLLDQGEVLMHPFVLGELACGNLRNRGHLLTLLRQLPQCLCASDAEVLYFIERKNLMGKGIGWVDAHLLAAAIISGTRGLWTRDRQLANVAAALSCAFTPEAARSNIHESAPY